MIATLFLLAAAPVAIANDAPSPPPSSVSLRLNAAEAHQGAASDGTYLYAIDNDRIGKYRIATGRRWPSGRGSGASTRT